MSLTTKMAQEGTASTKKQRTDAWSACHRKCLPSQLAELLGLGRGTFASTPEHAQIRIHFDLLDFLNME
jgi:hypothetical protein